jgi:phosphoglycerate dehydrogenase-like enzyme
MDVFDEEPLPADHPYTKLDIVNPEALRVRRGA